MVSEREYTTANQRSSDAGLGGSGCPASSWWYIVRPLSPLIAIPRVRSLFWRRVFSKCVASISALRFPLPGRLAFADEREPDQPIALNDYEVDGVEDFRFHFGRTAVRDVAISEQILMEDGRRRAVLDLITVRQQWEPPATDLALKAVPGCEYLGLCSCKRVRSCLQD